MITPEQARKIDPTLQGLSDEELESALKALYGFGGLAFDLWQESRDASSKNPLGVISDPCEGGTVVETP